MNHNGQSQINVDQLYICMSEVVSKRRNVNDNSHFSLRNPIDILGDLSGG